MKKFVLFFGVIALMAGTVMGQGAAPAPPSPFTTASNTLYNSFKPNIFKLIPITSGSDSTSYLEFTRFGGIKWLRPADSRGSLVGSWYLGSVGSPWDILYSDTVYVSANGVLRVGSYNYTRLDGVGLDASNGQLDVNLTNLVPTGWIIDSTILPQDISPTGAFTFANAYHNTALTDSAFITRYEQNTTLGGFPFTDLVGDTTIYNDYIIAWDSGNHTWYVRPDASISGAGDQITYDTGAGATSVVDPTFDGSISVNGNTITILGGNGRFGVATDTTFDAQNAIVTNLEYVQSDSVLVNGSDPLLVFDPTIGGTIRNASLIYGTSAAGLTLRSPGANAIGMQYGQTGGVQFYEGFTQSFDIDNNAIVGNGSSTISGLASLTTTAATIGGQVIDGTEDIISAAELTTALTPYVSTSTENWQDFTPTTGRGIRHSEALTDGTMSFDVILTDNQTDTAYVKTDKGSLVLQSGTTSNDAVILRGPSGGVTSFGSTVNHLGQNIDSIGNLDANYGTFDNAMRLMSGTTYYTEWQAPAGQTQNYVFTSPLGYGTNGQVLATNGAGGTSWTNAGAGGGVPIYVNDGSTEYSPDAPLLTEGSGISMTVSLNGGAGGKDQIALAASGLTATNFATDADIATETEVGDTATAFGLTRDEWHNRQSTTNYGNFAGSDSTWMLDAAGSGSRMLTLRRTHTGGDTTHILQDAGDGLVIGTDDATNVTVLDADTTRLSAASVLKYTGSAYNVKAANWDSVWAGLAGFYTLSAGAGDISAVGSMTGGDAFAGPTADEDWLGMGASAGRIQFEADGGTGGMDDIEILDGNLVVGARMDQGKSGLLMYNTLGSAGQDLGAWVEQSDSANGYDVRWDLVARSNAAGTTGGDPSFSFGSYDAGLVRSTFFNVGLDRSDAFRFKIVKSDAHGLSTTGDYFIMDTLGKTAITGGLYLDDGSMTADSQAATMGFVKARKPFVKNISDVMWSYPTAAVLGNDTTVLVTFPFEAVGMYDSTYLVKCSTEAGTDTAFIILEAPFEDSVVVDSVVLYYKTSNATFSNVGLDSMVCTKQTVESMGSTAITAQAAWNADAASTSYTRLPITLSGATGTTFAPGDKLKIRLRVNLTQNNSYLCVMKAQVKGTVQR